LEVERRQQYLDKMRGEAEVLRPLVEECLDDDPAVRPTIAAICERIQVIKDVCMKESPQDVITLHEQVEQLKTENDQLRREIDERDVQINLKTDNEQQKFKINHLKFGNNLKCEVDHLNQQLVSVINLFYHHHCYCRPPQGVYRHNK